jgi:hypothetical protein
MEGVAALSLSSLPVGLRVAFLEKTSDFRDQTSVFRLSADSTGH